jgi:hypothetical protein
MVPAAGLGGTFRTHSTGDAVELVAWIPDLDPAVWLAGEIEGSCPTSARRTDTAAALLTDRKIRWG